MCFFWTRTRVYRRIPSREQEYPQRKLWNCIRTVIYHTFSTPHLCSLLCTSWDEWNSARHSEMCQNWEFYHAGPEVDLKSKNNLRKNICKEALKSTGRGEGFCLSFPKCKSHLLAFFPNKNTWNRISFKSLGKQNTTNTGLENGKEWTTDKQP